MVPTPQLVAKLKQITTVDEFQAQFILPFLDQLIKTTTEGVSASGLENLDNQHSYLFMSNHRDIILDSALINVKLHEHGIETTEIAIGDNLLIYDWITDLVKLNKSFVVRRNLPIRQQMEASGTLSTFIRESIVNKHQNIWIAQREGRSKDGDDQTQGSVLKMLNLSGNNELIQNFEELNIIPVSISYELDPCDYLKAHQALLKSSDPNYQKSPAEDLIHMSTGLRGRKGRVHLSFGSPIKNEIENINDLGKNAQITAIAEAIDNQIHSHYKLWPCNYIAFDAINNSNQFAAEYTQAEHDEFIEYINEHISRIENLTDEDFVLKNILNMYANPVVNKIKAHGI